MQFIEPFSRPFPDVAFPALLGSKERQSDQIIKPDHIFFSQRRIGRKDQAPYITFRECDRLIFSLIGRITDNGEIQQALVQSLRDLFRVAARNMVFKTGVPLLQNAKFPSNVSNLIGLCKTKIQIAACKIVQRQELFLDLVCHRDKILCTIPKESAFFCERNAETVTGKQLFTQFILQRFQRLGKRRLCNMKHFGGSGHILFPRYCEKIT